MNLGVAPLEPIRGGDIRSRSQNPEHSFGRGSESFIRGESVSPKGSGRCIKTTPGDTDTTNQQLSSDQARKDGFDRSGHKISQTGLTSELNLESGDPKTKIQRKDSLQELGFGIQGDESFQLSVEDLVRKLKIMKIDKMREGYLQKRMNTMNLDETKRSDKRSQTIKQNVIDMTRITFPTLQPSPDMLYPEDSPMLNLGKPSLHIEKA